VSNPVVDRVTEAVAALPLVDHHCHGVFTRDLDRPGLEALVGEGGRPPAGATNFDTPVGLAIRRHCAPALGLDAHVPAEEYLARRAELGAAEVNRRLVGATGTAAFCVDTGFRPDGLTTPAELAALAGGRAHEIVRLEWVAEGLAATGVDPVGFGAAFSTALRTAVTASGAVGVKSIAAYRVGLDFDPHRPSAADVVRAAARWFVAGPGENGRWRLTDPVLTRHLLWSAVDLGLPIQFHVGWGDADIRLHRVDPSLLTEWLHVHRVPVTLLHCWPFQRQASYLAAVHPHVYLDVGMTLHYVGPTRAAAVLAEAAELTPFGKLLYSSDAFGAPELYHLGALTFRGALTTVLTERVASGEWSASDAVRIAHLVGHENATRLYRLPAGAGERTATATATAAGDPAAALE
jgi:predicted TIM-barrel fold metal-dependent hydrolase